MQSKRRALLFLNAQSRNGHGNMANGVARQLQSGGITENGGAKVGHGSGGMSLLRAV